MKLRAPGKLFLIGEYGVLEGGQAVVAAVDRHALIETAPANSAQWVDELGAVQAHALIDNPPGPGPRALVQAVISTLSERSVPLSSVRVSADSSALSAEQKLGLGSSGAVCAGLVRAGAPSLDPAAALDLALAAHRRFQGGRGSGGDVIASAMGGVNVVRTNTLVRQVSAPVGGFALVYTGVSADTRIRVDQFKAWRESPDSAAVLEGLHRAADAGISALDAQDSWAWNVAVREFAAREREMTAGGVEVFSEPVEGCVCWLEERGWAAKPSGAGGGDVVVAFHPSEPASSLDAGLAATRYSRIPLALEPSGVLVSPP